MKKTVLFICIIGVKALVGCQKGSSLHPDFILIPVDAECHNTQHYQCLKGKPFDTREEEGFYKWSCLGFNGGADVHTCSQPMVLQPVNGKCDETTHYQCLDGTTPANTREEEGFYKWSCLGLNGGTHIHTCRQAIPIDGKCDETTHYQCLDGTTPANTREEDDLYKWSCLGLNDGDDLHTCQLPAVQTKQNSFEVTQSLLKMGVDILIIIDNSGSMEKHQQQLGDRFGDLTSSLEDVNWQMAFINTDERGTEDGDRGYFYNLEDENGEFETNGDKIQILTPDLPNAQTLFLNTISKEERGSGMEKPFTNFIYAIQHSNNQNFFREDTGLAVIILTNEGAEPKTAEDVTDAVEDEFGIDKKFYVYGIICKDDECPMESTSNPDYTTKIRELATQTEGRIEDINSDDYAPILKNIGSNISSKLTLTEVTLRHQNIIPTSVSLTFTPTNNEVEWTFNSTTNKVVFKEPPPENTTIHITYSYKERL